MGRNDVPLELALRFDLCSAELSGARAGASADRLSTRGRLRARGNVVTAQRRTESLGERAHLHLGVSRRGTGEFRDQSSLRNPSDHPNLYFEDEGGALGSSPVIRGITSSSSGVSSILRLACTSMVFSSGETGRSPKSWSIVERIEVLRGPQARLRAQCGRRCDQYRHSPARAGHSWYGSRRSGELQQSATSASLSGPAVADKLFFGVAGSYSERDVYYTNELLSRNIGDNSNRSGSLTLRATPTDRFEIRPRRQRLSRRGSPHDRRFDRSRNPSSSPFPLGLLFGYQARIRSIARSPWT